MTKTLSVTIDVEPNEQMLSVCSIEGESGYMMEFGPTPLWYDWKSALKDQIGNEVISWVEMMMDGGEDNE